MLLLTTGRSQKYGLKKQPWEQPEQNHIEQSIHDSAYKKYFAATKTYMPESTTLPAARCSCYLQEKLPSVSYILQMTSICGRDRSSLSFNHSQNLFFMVKRGRVPCEVPLPYQDRQPIEPNKKLSAGGISFHVVRVGGQMWKRTIQFYQGHFY